MTATTSRNPLAMAKQFALRALHRPFPPVAEAKDVEFDSIAVEESAAGRVLRIEGLVFHSALSVSAVASEQKGDAVIVEVGLAPAGGGRSGSFAAEIPLPPQTRRVLFGRELASIWQDTQHESLLSKHSG